MRRTSAAAEGSAVIAASMTRSRPPRYAGPRMRILYGVVGEGMGHAMRSRVILDELCKRHEVQVVVSGRAYDYLKTRASEHLAVQKIWGYSVVYEDNEVQRFKTLLENMKGA